MFDKSSNPVLRRDTFESAFFTGTQSESMTIRGTVNKTIIMLLVVVFGASYTWKIFFPVDFRITAACISVYFT